jgi:predicted dienelactone hydrolase
LVDDLELYDRKRDKKLPLLIRYPQSVLTTATQPACLPFPPPRWITPGDGTPPGSDLVPRIPTAQPENPKLPLVIFSHGAGGSGDAFGELSRHLASHGYVVIHPTHSDSLKARPKAGEDLRGLRDDPRQIRRNVDPQGRLDDVRLILDRLDKIEQEVAGLHDAARVGRIDRDRIAIAGHSAGALTTQMAIGVKTRGMRAAGGRGGIRSQGDARLKAAVVISGQGLTNLMFTEESWRDLAKPMLVFAGSLDTTAISDETPESRRHPFEYSRPGDKYLVWIEGATHGSYQGRELSRFLGESPTTDVKVITNAVASATLAFLDAHIRDATEARKYLAGNGLSRLTGGAANLSAK